MPARKKKRSTNSASSPVNRSKSGGVRERRSLEVRRRISETMLGQKKSANHRAKIANAMKGEKNPRYGKTVSEETRRKIAEKLRLSWQVRPRNRLRFGPKRRKGPLPIWRGDQFGYGAVEEVSLNDKKVKGVAKKSSSEGRTSKLTDKGIRERDWRNWEGLLTEIREGRRPPEAVKKAMENQKRMVGQMDTYNSEKQEIAMVACKACEGAGMIQCSVCIGDDPFGSSGCKNCQGVGAVWCSDCQGRGKTPEAAP